MRRFTYHFDTGERQFQYHYAIGQHIPSDHLPHWTTHAFKECIGCRSLGHDHCLAAATLVEPIKLLDKLASFEELDVTVEGPERTYTKHTSAQTALSSLFGLLMATSGCPSFDFLKGLAHYHLPFASYEETLFRAVSAHFLLKYLHGETEGSPAALASEIQAIYDQVREANLIISKRLKQAINTSQSDSPMNALIILDSFGALVPMSVESGLEDLRKAFL